MKLKVAILYLSLLFANSIFAHKKGFFLVDSINKTPIGFAKIQSEDLKFVQISEENGFVYLDKLPIHSKILKISSVGFEPKIIVLSNFAFDKEIPIIFLQPKISSLSEVNIVSNSATGVFKTFSDLDIHLRQIQNSQEVLRMVPGLFIGQHAGGGKAEQIFLRGFDIDHGTDVQITSDGMPVNMVSHAHGQGYADLHFVIPELIDKVNFNKGPYFADKGNFTTAGFVEFKSKKFLERDFIKIEGGQFGTFRAVTAINLLPTSTTRRNKSLYFAGEGSFTKGYFDSPQDFNRFNGVLKYHQNFAEHNTFTATISGFTSKWNASGQIPLRAIASGQIGFYGAIDDTEGGSTSRNNINLELFNKLDNGASFKNQIFYSNYLFELYSNFTFFKEDPINGDQIRQKENRNIFGYNSIYQQDFFIGNIKNTLKSGIQARYDLVNGIELTRTIDRIINSNSIMYGDIKELNLGLFYTQEMALSNKLNATLGLRIDYFDNAYLDKLTVQNLTTNAAILSPKLNFNYTVNDKVQLYWFNGKGFHSNDTRVAVQQEGKKVLPPAYGSDVGGIFKIGSKLFLQTAIWYLWLDQEFIYVGDEGVVEPGGKTKRFGLDVSARYEIVPNLFADLDVNFAKPRALDVPNGEHFLPLAPTFTSIGGLQYRKQNGWSGSLRYRYMADRAANETNSVLAKGYFICDGTIQYVLKKWEVGLSIQNLFNTEWKETQFETESKLKEESEAVSEIHFTPGTPFFARLSLIYHW